MPGQWTEHAYWYQNTTCYVRVRSAMSWTEDETLQLLDLWGDANVQAQLEGCQRNKRVYEKISKEMEAVGYKRTAVQCRDKIKKLRAEYKRVKDHNGLTGRGTRKWRYYDSIDAILGHRPSTRPPIVLDTSSDTILLDSKQSSEHSKRTSEHSDTDDETDDDKENDSLDCIVPQEDTAKVSKGAEKDKEIKKRTDRKRQTKAELVDKAIDGAMAKVAKVQEDSDKRFLEVEERRQEMEDRRRKEDREFQLKV